MLALLVACGGLPQGQGPPGKDEEGAKSEPDRRVLVEVQPAQKGAVADHLVTTGVLESEAQADLVPETSGVVTQVAVEEGDRVKAGQLLAVISSPMLDANASRADIELDRVRRAARQADLLHDQGAISDTERDQARATLQVAEATWQEANRSRGFTRITSPIAGTVSIRDVRLGEMAGGKRAFQVVDLSRLRVVVQLPEKDLFRVSVGQVVELTGAYDESATGAGRVERISPVVDSATGTVRVTVAVDPPPDDGGPVTTGIRPGQFVKVRVQVDRHDDVLTIPRRGLLWVDGEPIAWTVVDAPPEEKKDEEGKDGDDEEPGWLKRQFSGDAKADEENGEGEPEKDPWEGIPRRAAKRVKLEVGYSDPHNVEVSLGLAEGDQVVVIGNNNLREDSLVRLPGDPAPKKEEPEEHGDKAEDKGEEG